MMSLEKYLEKKDFNYKLPLSFWEKTKFFYDIKFLFKIPFRKRVFVSSIFGISIFFEILINFLKKELNLEFSKNILSLNGKYFSTGFLLSNKSDGKKMIGAGIVFENKEIALSKTIGEFLERFSFSEISEKERPKSITKKADYLTKNSLKIYTDFHNFTNTISFTEREEFLCVPVTEIISNKKYFYPAQFIFYREKKLAPNEKRKIDLTTSGCAGGFSEKEVILSAIYENVERDSFFCYWLTKSVPIRINVDVENFAYKKIKHLIENTDYELYVLDTTTDLNIPSVVSLLLDKKVGGLILSGASSINMEKAVESSIRELPFMFHLFNETKTNNYLPDTIGRKERLFYWAFKMDMSSIQFLLKGPEKKLSEYNKFNFGSKEEELLFVTSKFKEKTNCYDQIFVYVAKNKVLSKLGYTAIRVIMPKLYPLYLYESKMLPFSLRLQEFNLWKNGGQEFVLNVEPHPFP